MLSVRGIFDVSERGQCTGVGDADLFLDYEGANPTNAGSEKTFSPDFGNFVKWTCATTLNVRNNPIFAGRTQRLSRIPQPSCEALLKHLFALLFF